MEEKYEKKYYEMANSDARAIGNSWKIKKMVDFLNVKLKPGDKILEIGCGTAAMAEIFDKKIFYYGIDISRYAVLEAQKRIKGKSNATIITARAEDLPFRDGEFNAIVSVFTLEHLNKPRESLLEMIRVLKTGGYLFLIAPNLELPFSYPSALRHRSRLFRLKFYFVRFFDYIKCLLGKNNFRVLKDNYLKTTGRYEKKDDDLVYLVSSYEVINFLRKRNFKFVFINKFNPVSLSIKEIIKNFITYLPGMKYYGTELFIIAEKL